MLCTILKFQLAFWKENTKDQKLSSYINFFTIIPGIRQLICNYLLLSSLSNIFSDRSLKLDNSKDLIPLVISYPKEKRIVNPYLPLSLIILFIP